MERKLNLCMFRDAGNAGALDNSEMQDQLEARGHLKNQDHA